MGDNAPSDSVECRRLDEEARREKNWKRWGPYLSDRQWGTVREDYSKDGSAWRSFPQEHAPLRAYRWGEDGLLGITDRECRLCFALALWNGKDPILKERPFGLTNREGNHGEDVKEYYFYLDAVPTNAYLKALYKYPQNAFPYKQLVEENQNRGLHDPEFELLDTGIFDDNRYFDVVVEYAKAAPNDILIRITVQNRGPDDATLHLLPTLWFRNTWIWGCRHEGCTMKPRIEHVDGRKLKTDHETLEPFFFEFDAAPGGSDPAVLFTENETNTKRLYNHDNYTPYTKDAFHRHVVDGEHDAVNPEHTGTKAAPYYVLQIPAGGEQVVRCRLYAEDETPSDGAFGKEFDQTFATRIDEADAFYASHIDQHVEGERRSIARQAYAGLLWNKQFYHYIVEDWLQGDPEMPAPPPERWHGRNADWTHLFNRDVISMPDKWEYPWYATWDLAFHLVTMARIDPTFAKNQLILFLREWYMHPSGAMPAYEYDFGDVNPPVHAWACWRVYKMAAPRGERDTEFLARAFQKLLLNFTWWVNRKDRHGKHIFAGGFLGLDNIGVFDRSKPLPGGGYLNQADGTAWMAFYCTTMLAMALELAQEDAAYEDMASKFFEHFVDIADAVNNLGGTGLWDEDEGFYFDQLHVDGTVIPLRVRSLVGLLPLLAVEVIGEDLLERLPGFAKRTRWFLDNRKDLARTVTLMDRSEEDTPGKRMLLALPSRDRLKRVLQYMLNEDEFLSPFGIRSLSRAHKDDPFTCTIAGNTYEVHYVPGEADTHLFGGNSNWRGPIWFPVNYLLVEALERYHHYYGDTFTIEFPTGSGNEMTFNQIADQLAHRLINIFLPGDDGRRPGHGGDGPFAKDAHWRDLPLFHEYYHGETGRGLGASHQTGWTALVARCIQQVATREL